MSNAKTEEWPPVGVEPSVDDDPFLSARYTGPAALRKDDARGIIAEKVVRWLSKAVSLLVKAVDSHMLVRCRCICRSIMAVDEALCGLSA